MTNVKEQSTPDNYQKVELVEFLESLGRVAVERFKGTPLGASLSLAEKLEAVLGQVLPLVNRQVIQIDKAALEETESDNEF